MLKRGIILIIFLIVFLKIAIAIPPPASLYCENMGYSSNGTHCIFDDGNSCEESAFYYGECGIEYVKDLPCKELGESFSPGYNCCEGLIPISNAVPDPKDGCIYSIGLFGFCAACGDGICDSEYENKCNCHEDCYGECYSEGETFDLLDDQDAECCPGLKQIRVASGEPPNCALTSCPCYICAYCGNGDCDSGENPCNCPQDCEEPIFYQIEISRNRKIEKNELVNAIQKFISGDVKKSMLIQAIQLWISCGDGVCSGIESCKLCSQDCGVC